MTCSSPPPSIDPDDLLPSTFYSSLDPSSLLPELYHESVKPRLLPQGQHYWLEEMTKLRERRQLHPYPELAPPPCNSAHMYMPNMLCAPFEKFLMPTDKMKQRRLDVMHVLHPTRWDEY